MIYIALKKVGVLWKKDSKNNQEYLSGQLDLGAMGEAKIMVFKNNKKEDKQPDYSISLATDDDATQK